MCREISIPAPRRLQRRSTPCPRSCQIGSRPPVQDRPRDVASDERGAGVVQVTLGTALGRRGEARDGRLLWPIDSRPRFAEDSFSPPRHSLPNTHQGADSNTSPHSYKTRTRDAHPTFRPPSTPRGGRWEFDREWRGHGWTGVNNAHRAGYVRLLRIKQTARTPPCCNREFRCAAPTTEFRDSNLPAPRTNGSGHNPGRSSRPFPRLSCPRTRASSYV